MSTVNLLHYREWHGQLRRPLWSLWPITRVALQTLFRRRLVWILYAAGLLLFLMFFFGTFLLDWAQTQIPGNMRWGWGSIQLDSERMMKAFRGGLEALNGSYYTYAYFFVYQGGMVMVVLAFAGSILVGNDIAHHSVPFYLAKPLSRWHYI